MAVYRRTARTRFVLLVLVLAAITLVTLDAARATAAACSGQVRGKAQDAFAPVQDATHSVLRPVGDFFTGVVHYGDVKRENARLRDQLARAQGPAGSRRPTAQRELQLLLDQQHLDFVGNIPTVAAEVVDTSSSNFELSVQVNRGTDSGVAVGMPVVAGGRPGRPGGRGVGQALDRAAAHRPDLQRRGAADHHGDVGGGRRAPAGATRCGSTWSIPATKVKVGRHRWSPAGCSSSGSRRTSRSARCDSVKPGAGRAAADRDPHPAVDSGRLEFVQVLQWSPQ